MLKEKIKWLYTKFLRKYVKRKITNINEEPIEYKKDKLLMNLKGFVQKASYKDEHWNYIAKIHELYNNRFWHKKINIEDNGVTNTKIKYEKEANKLIFKSSRLPEDWIYYFMNKDVPQNFALSFKTKINHLFKEFQIGFRHQSIFERYRFRIVHNEVLYFEIMHGGIFHVCCIEKNFHFEESKEYEIQIVSKNNHYGFYANGKQIMHIKDNYKIIKDGGIALIFWDNTGYSNIDFEISDLELYSIT